MNPREKFIKTIKGENTDIPIFCPAIYDYKVNFSDTSLNLFGQSESEFIAAAEKEINLLQPEVLTCGYDIYNIETEALGAAVNRKKIDIFPEITTPLINDLNELESLPKLNDLGGRMPLFINATKRINYKYNEQVYIRGAVSGPFSMAGRLYSNNQLILDCILNPQGVHRLLEFCTDIIITHLRGYIQEKQDVVIFDSLASPPLVSPEIYTDLILPFHQRIFEYMRKNEMEIRPLIMGGNTLPIIEKLTTTGANQLLLDYTIPLNEAKVITDQYNLAFRINIDPAIVAHHDLGQLSDQINQIFTIIGPQPNLIIGTGILLTNTPLKNIQFIRNYLIQYFNKNYN